MVKKTLHGRTNKTLILLILRTPPPFGGGEILGDALRKYVKNDPDILIRQVNRLDKVKYYRDNKAVERALTKLKDEAKRGDNLIPCLVKTVKTYASIGEIMGVLKDVFDLCLS